MQGDGRELWDACRKGALSIGDITALLEAMQIIARVLFFRCVFLNIIFLDIWTFPCGWKCHFCQYMHLFYFHCTSNKTKGYFQKSSIIPGDWFELFCMLWNCQDDQAKNFQIPKSQVKCRFPDQSLWQQTFLRTPYLMPFNSRLVFYKQSMVPMKAKKPRTVLLRISELLCSNFLCLREPAHYCCASFLKATPGRSSLTSFLGNSTKSDF